MSVVARVGFVGRLMLILMAALIAMIALTVGIDHLAHRSVMPPGAEPYPRVVHGAGVLALARTADAEQRRLLARYGSNTGIRVEILDAPPPVKPNDFRAPGMEARLRAVGATGTGLVAYTDTPSTRTVDGRRLEGWLTKIVAPLDDGRSLVIEWQDPPRIVYFTFLGWPPGVWTGMIGLIVAALALFAVSRELRPLRRLTEAVARFDGGKPAPTILDTSGAPDVRRLVEAVRDMQQRVAALVGERTFLIGAISHDLRIYLTRLRLRAETMPDIEARARLVGDLDGMACLIDTSLAFARATTSAAKPSLVDLGDLVAIEVEEHAALGPKVRLEGTYADHAVVAGDPTALRRVVANVLDNALRFARSVVTVRVERTPMREQILIEDDGPGILEAERDRVFDPFYRVDARARGAGSGLGLAIARQIVEAHGGTIEVSEAASAGAAFRIALPPVRA